MTTTSDGNSGEHAEDASQHEAPGRRTDQLGAVWLWWAVVAVVTGITIADSFRWKWFIHPDLLIARRAGHALLTSQGLHVYVTHPLAQMGPVALLLSLLPRPVYLLLIGLMLAPVLLRLADAGLAISGRSWTYATTATASFSAAVCVVPWSQLVWKGHADDALVLLGAALMLPSRSGTAASGRAMTADRVRQLAGVAVAAVGKPTAVILLALAAGWDLPLAIGAVVVFAVIWAPFVLAGPHGFLSAGGGVMPVGHASLPDYLGYRVGRHPPSWIRAAQLGGGFVLATWLVLRRRPAHAVLAAFTLRALLDPNPAPAYSISVVVLALVVDVGQPVAWATALAAVSFWTAQPVLGGGTGWFRIGSLLALLVLLLVTALRRPDELPDTGSAVTVARCQQSLPN